MSSQSVVSQPVTAVKPTASSARPPARLTAPDLLMLFVVLIWATHFSIAKAAIEVIPSPLYNALRFPIGTLVVFLILKVSGIGLSIRRGRLPQIALVGLVAFILYQFFFMHGLQRTTVANSVLISTVAPCGIVLLNIVSGKERGSKRIYTGLMLALSGVSLVILSRYAGQISFGGETIVGDLLSIVAAGVWVASTTMQRGVIQNDSALVIQFWLLLIGSFETALFAVPDALAFDWSSLTPNVQLAILYAGCIPVGITSLVWAFSLKRLGTSRASTFMNLQPIVAATVAILFLGEAFTIWLVIGTVIVLTGMWLIRKG